MTRARRAAIVSGSALLAFACGIALGAGPFSGDSDDGTGAGSADVGSSDKSSDKFQSSFAAKGGAALAENRLESASAVVITLPEAPDAAVKGVEDGLEDAGADHTGTIALQPKLLSTSNRQFSVNVAEQSAKVKSDEDSEDYDVIGQALAKAYVDKKPDKLNDRQSTIGSAFVDAGLIGTTQAPSTSADLVVFVAGPHASEGASDVVADFAEQIDDAGRGTVVAEPSDASDDGFVPAIRESGLDISTFDELDSAAGQRAVALVAIEELKGKAGSYGSDDADDGPFPQ